MALPGAGLREMSDRSTSFRTREGKLSVSVWLKSSKGSCQETLTEQLTAHMTSPAKPPFLINARCFLTYLLGTRCCNWPAEQGQSF